MSVWKPDFPVVSDEMTLISRRKFTKSLCMISGGLVLGMTSVYSQTGQENEHLVCPVSELAVGETRSFTTDKKGKKPYILIRLAEDQWKCYSQKCTHMGCKVNYVPDTKQFLCPCHKGVFNPENGEVVKGPPKKALPQLPVVVREDNVYVTLSA
ncbi:MAG: Rieske (2Fe-2S) protein [Tannerella sp.]|nr:Rieske (2Fe-2S) protein [Tannerella sp.]